LRIFTGSKFGENSVESLQHFWDLNVYKVPTFNDRKNGGTAGVLHTCSFLQKK
jgi:hypothetical protein